MALAETGDRAPRGGARLPRRRTSFLGREDDVDGVVARLRSAPALTLLGVGGVGKTRLAYEVAARIERESETHVIVVELAATRAEDGVARVVADALDLPVTAAQAPVEAIAAHLVPLGPTLVVLDNCEHLVGASAELVDDLLDRCPDLTVLATSRVALGVEGEFTWPVDPLPVETAGVADGPAVQLLIDRAEAAHPRALDDVDHDELVELATRLDGVPLALELAAGRLSTMGVPELLRQLDRHLPELGSSRRATVERHRSLSDVVDWSYQLLTDAEQTLAAKLSVFRGSFTREAAATVLGIEDLAPLERLAEVSLLTVVDRGAGSRFLMLEMIREFLSQRLEETGSADEVRRAYAQWAAGFVIDLQRQMRGPDEMDARQRLRTDIAHVGAGLEWAADAGATEIVVQIVRGLHDEVLAGGGREVHAWLEQAVDAVWSDPEGVDVLATGATGAMVRGDIVRYREVMERWDELGVEGVDVVIDRRLEWASLLVFEGRVDDAVAIVSECSDDLPPDAWRASHVLMRCAQPFAYAGRSEAALALTERSLAEAERTGNPTAMGWALYINGEAVMGVDPTRAIEDYDGALRLARSVDNAFLVGLLSVALASALGRHGEPERALLQFRETLEHWRAVGGWSFLSTTLRNFGELLVRLERLEEAVSIRCALEHLEASSGAGGVDAERDRYLRRLLSERLGADRFGELRRDSRSLGRDDVLDLAFATIAEELQARTRVVEFRVIVFTDLERSTQFVSEAGDVEARAAIREYEDLTKQALLRHAGEWVKGTGDGALLVFRSVTDALQCMAALAATVSDAVARGDLPLRLRAGIHAGETIAELGDVHGTVVNLAARVADRAEGGEVLVTDTVRQIAAGSDHVFTPLGEASLKGIPEPIRIHRLEWS